MSDRLTDKKVSIMAEVDPRWDGTKLAREVQEYRALRPTCPTCNGKPTGSIRECSNGFGGYYDCCPDCADGKMPLAEWVELLVETLGTVRGALDLDGLWVRRLAQVDAVLKMAGKP